jgi:hypothetical protein
MAMASKKVYFNGFWGGFIERTDPISVDFFTNLLFDIYGEQVSITESLDDANILVECAFTNKYFVNYKAWDASFLFTGESYHNAPKNTYSSYTCILGPEQTGGNFVAFPFYVLYMKLYPHNMAFSPTKSITNNNTAAVIGYHHDSARCHFLDALEKRMPVLYGGRYKNNIGGKIEGHFASDSLCDFYKGSKFVVTMENTKIGHYITEKLINGLRAGIIPIYWGSSHIAEYFNTKRFLILEDDSVEQIDAVIDRMANMSEEEYFRIVNEPIFNTGVDFDTIYNNIVCNIKKLALNNKN